jgi:hypothetical protein
MNNVKKISSKQKNICNILRWFIIIYINNEISLLKICNKELVLENWLRRISIQTIYIYISGFNRPVVFQFSKKKERQRQLEFLYLDAYSI